HSHTALATRRQSPLAKNANRQGSLQTSPIFSPCKNLNHTQQKAGLGLFDTLGKPPYNQGVTQTA
ncbi:MAG: hypothetical protein J5I90_10920, partial [Caldilineales bacterium]|nr:hypothetical protein [Caldilineales bacterium]